MATAARPGPSDARVSCPLCSGQIHPIAGKCKHCKADLTSYRSSRPAANAPLPPLHPHGGNGHGNGHAGPPPHAPIAHAAPAVAAAHEVQPVLPPRPTGRSPTAPPTASTWRSWPVLVIALAMMAIVVAAVLMVWPSSRERLRDPGKHALQPPPAPEHMQTEPDIKAAPNRAMPKPSPRGRIKDQMQTVPRDDPWDTSTDTPQVAPQTTDPMPNPLDSSLDSNDADDVALDALKDPFAASRAPVIDLMFEHLCRKLNECHIDDPTAIVMCERMTRNPTPPPAHCPAAVHCLRLIDSMSCANHGGASFARLSAQMTQIKECVVASHC